MKIILLAALTIDGKLARGPEHFVDWSSREDKRLFASTSKQAGVIIMGHNTYKTLPSPLPGRLHVVLTFDLEGKQNLPGVVEFTDRPPKSIVADLEARGYSEVILGGGAQINTLFLQSGLVDEIWLTIEPRIFGQGINLFGDAALDQRAELIHVERLNDAGSVNLRYKVIRTE